MGSDHERESPRDFQLTRWSVILRAQDVSAPKARHAMESLCRTYWYPLYFFIRRKYGYDHHRAEDSTQAFFEHLLSKNHVKAADRERGKFRTFLLAYLENFLNNEFRKDRAQKRGGDRIIVSIDEDTAEARYRAEPSDDATPEKLFDRNWALKLFDVSVEELQQDYAGRGKDSLFEAIKPYLAWNSGESTYAEVANRLGITANNVGVEINRLRKRFRSIIRHHIEDTVDSPDKVDDELKYLCSLLT